MKKRNEIRDQQICIYLSEREKEDLDYCCNFYFNSSRADFIRIAMFIATFNPEVFMDAGIKALDEGYLTKASHRRKRKE